MRTRWLALLPILLSGVLGPAMVRGATAHEPRGSAPAGSPAPAPAGGAGRAAAERPLSESPGLSRIRAAPDFTLRDTEGTPVRLSELRGRVVLLSFIYTTCTTACPLLSARMAVLQARLASGRPRADAPRLLSVTVDPERDTADALRRYARGFRADPRRWKFLREEPERLGPVLAAYDEWTRRLPNGEVDHPARLYLIDARGDVREIYALGFFDERQAWLDVQALQSEAAK